MSGKNAIFGYGRARSKGVPGASSTYAPFATETLKMDRPGEPNPNLDPSGAKSRDAKLKASGGGDVQAAGDSESWLLMRAVQHGYYEVDEVVASEVYLWALRSFVSGVDTPVFADDREIWFRIWRDQQTNPREYTGMWAVPSEFELSVDAHKFAMFKHTLIYLRDRYMGKPEEVAVNAAYTGGWESRGHRARGDVYGADIYFEVSTAGALGVAKIKFGSRLTVSITSVGTVATAVSLVPHGLTTGNTVSHSGATPAEYNVADAVTVVDPYTYTYDIVDADDVPATGTPVAKVLGATEYLIADDWMEVYRANGQRRGTRREPVQIHPTSETGDAFTLGDSWRIASAAPRPTPVYTERPRLTGTDMSLTFEIDGVPKTIVIAKSFSLKHVTPREGKEGLGSVYLQDIGEPADSQEYWEASFPRTYVDTDFELALIADSTISVVVTLYGTPIGDTGEDDFVRFTLPNMSISAAGTTITGPGDLDETVTLRTFPDAEGTPICLEEYQNTIASIEEA